MSEPLEFLEKRIQQLENELRHYKMLRDLLQKGQAESPQQPQQPQPQDLDGLPWRPYKDGGGEWVYRDEAPEDFVTQLLQAGKPVRVGGFVYSMKSGSTGKTFISRRRVK